VKPTRPTHGWFDHIGPGGSFDNYADMKSPANDESLEITAWTRVLAPPVGRAPVLLGPSGCLPISGTGLLKSRCAWTLFGGSDSRMSGRVTEWCSCT